MSLVPAKHKRRQHSPAGTRRRHRCQHEDRKDMTGKHKRKRWDAEGCFVPSCVFPYLFLMHLRVGSFPLSFSFLVSGHLHKDNKKTHSMDARRGRKRQREERKSQGPSTSSCFSPSGTRKQEVEVDVGP